MSTMRMPWGKHRGQRLCDVPLGYLAWLLEEGRQLEPALRRALRAELADRLGLEPPPPPSRPMLQPPTAAIARAAADIVAAGYRAVALRAHPDQGGTHDAMIAATQARDWLRRQVSP